MTIQSINPFLWFDTQAEDAANFYVGLLPNSRILSIMRTPEGVPGPRDGVLVVDAEIAGQRVQMMNGGSTYKLSNAFSFMVNCETQEDIDRLWTAFCDGGTSHACGWVTDRFGLTWQVNYAGWTGLLEKNAEKAMAAMMTMIKIDIQALKDAVA